MRRGGLVQDRAERDQMAIILRSVASDRSLHSQTLQTTGRHHSAFVKVSACEGCTLLKRQCDFLHKDLQPCSSTRTALVRDHGPSGLETSFQHRSSNPGSILPVWSSHIQLVTAQVSPGCSGFLQHPKDVRVSRLIGPSVWVRGIIWGS